MKNLTEKKALLYMALVNIFLISVFIGINQYNKYQAEQERIEAHKVWLKNQKQLCSSYNGKTGIEYKCLKWRDNPDYQPQILSVTK